MILSLMYKLYFLEFCRLLFTLAHCSIVFQGDGLQVREASDGGFVQHGHQTATGSAWAGRPAGRQPAPAAPRSRLDWVSRYCT